MMHDDRLDEMRRCWGRVFSEFRSACELANAARYRVEDRQVLKDEEVRRLQALIRDAQKKINDWEA